MQEIYKSWIPNVSGCLSFSNIKGRKIPGRAATPYTCNRLSEDTERTVFSLQKRNLSDALYSVADSAGMFYFLLSAKIVDTSNHDELIGRIIALPELLLGKAEKSLIASIRTSSDPQKNDEEELTTSLAGNPKAIQVNFELSRDGFARFWVEGETESITSSLILEAYSFLKDLVHAHKFHRHDHDAIVVPYLAKNSDDTEWIVKTIRNLHKSIVSAYRNAIYKTDLIEAIGRLSYLESFQQILKQKEIHLPHNVYTPTLRSSLETKLSSIEYSENGSVILLQIFVPIFLTLIALIVAMGQLLQIPCIDGLTYTDETCKIPAFHLSGNSIYAARTLLENWFELAVLLPGFTVLVIFFAHLQDIFHWLNHRIGHGFVGWIQRVTLGIAVSTRYGRILASAWILILVAVLIFLAYVASGMLLSKNF